MMPLLSSPTRRAHPWHREARGPPDVHVLLLSLIFLSHDPTLMAEEKGAGQREETFVEEEFGGQW